MTKSGQKKQQLKPQISTEEDNDKASGTTEATLENDSEYDDEKENTESSGIVETDDEIMNFWQVLFQQILKTKVEDDELVVP